MTTPTIHNQSQLENMLDQILDKAEEISARAGNRLLNQRETDFIHYVETNLPKEVKPQVAGKITKAYELARSIY